MKKYGGMKFESKAQKKPVFEAKGLETVRRDQCALTQKILRNALIKLFNSGIDAVKDYLFRQWSLIYAGNLPLSDFILTGRVRSRYRGGREGPVQVRVPSSSSFPLCPALRNMHKTILCRQFLRIE
jgi:DNA polymerase zeta